MISVFGSTGFIGSQFSSMYSDEVTNIARDSNTPVSNSDILYLISTTHNYHVFDNIHLDVDTNLTKLLNVLEQFKINCSGNVFNFVSSWFVYGDTDFPARENSVCNPKGFYSITKYTAEKLVESYCKTFNLKYKIFRLCNVYGEKATGVSKKRNALQFMISNVINNKEISLYNDGQDVRDFMHVEDVCLAMRLCIAKGNVNDVINIGSGIPQTFRVLMEYVKNKINSTSSLISVDPPEFHKIVQVKDMYLDTTKLKNLGFKQTISIWDGIERILTNERC